MLGDEDMARLERALASERWEERREGLRLLGNSRDPRAVAAISRLLDDPNSEVGVAAVQALGALGTKDSIPHLLAELKNLFRNRRRRREALMGLGRIGDPSVVPELARVLEGPDHYVKDAAIAALTEFRATGLPVLKTRLAEERDIALRLLLAFALVQLDDHSGLPVFTEVLVDHVAAPDRWDPKAIAAVVVAAGEHGLREALPALRILSRDVRFDRMFPGLAGRAMRAIEAGISGSEDTMTEARPLPREKRVRPVEEDSDTPAGAFVVSAHGPVDEDADTPVPGHPAAGSEKGSGTP